MLDIRYLRENSEQAAGLLALRGPEWPEMIRKILECDTARRKAETELQKLQSERKSLSKSIGQLRAKGEDSSSVEETVRQIGVSMSELEASAKALDEQQRELLLQTPNIPHEAVPRGAGAEENPEIRRNGELPTPGPMEDHVSIATRLGLMDFERAVKISGSGFTCYTGKGAKLERALISFLLDLHTESHGYLEVNPPFLIRRECMEGTGQLPKFEEDMYGVSDSDLFLAPTAEVPVTNLRRGEILRLEEFPVKYAAYTPCFRREAGATGRDNRGIIRMHQFDKVELVKICAAESSAEELEKLTADAEKVLQLLRLPYRVIELCAGDLGFSSKRTYDIEVWSPGQNGWLEVSSCSNFGDYQARRMNLRYKGEDGKNHFCHTLNGSGTALARLVVALLENHLQPDGSIALPEPLHPYFGSSHIQ